MTDLPQILIEELERATGMFLVWFKYSKLKSNFLNRFFLQNLKNQVFLKFHGQRRAVQLVCYKCKRGKNGFSGFSDLFFFGDMNPRGS